MTADSELIAENLHMLGIEELEPAGRYHCRRCDSTWQYRPLPNWWHCPTPLCTDWMQTGGPRVQAAMRQLSGRRPIAIEGARAKHAPIRGGRPRRPSIAVEHLREVFEKMQAEQGRYPADADLAHELELSRRTIQNYRAKGYLPERPLDERAHPRK